METEPVKALRRINFLVLIISLGTVAAMLGALLAVLTQAMAGADPSTKTFLARMAWAVLAVLAGTLVLLVWVMTRYIAYRLRPRETRKPTEYVDAWALAGKRFKLQDEPQQDQDEEGPEEEPKGPD